MLPCFVLNRSQIFNHVQHVIHRCNHGVLNVCSSASEVEEFSGTIDCSLAGWKEASLVSLREAAQKQAPWNAFIANSCKCTTGLANAAVLDRRSLAVITVMEPRLAATRILMQGERCLKEASNNTLQLHVHLIILGT